jgi:hypothetical protein
VVQTGEEFYLEALDIRDKSELAGETARAIGSAGFPPAGQQAAGAPFNNEEAAW